MEKKLYKSKNNKMLDGVCAGIAEYIHVDPTVIRLLFVFGTAISAIGGGILAYVICAIIIPREP